MMPQKAFITANALPQLQEAYTHHFSRSSAPLTFHLSLRQRTSHQALLLSCKSNPTHQSNFNYEMTTTRRSDPDETCFHLPK
jgi:hypothetical protein